MRICPVCHSQVSDESYYCTMCGNRLPDDPQPVPSQPQFTAAATQPPICNPYDHTAKFDAQDISAHKLYAMLMYLTGIIGILLALLGAKESAYVQFHLRQNMKLLVIEVMLGILAAGTFFTVIGPIILAVCLLIVEIIRIVSFIHTAQGKSVEPAMIRSIGFLK